ncbi:MAG: DUF2007 domain-containing protein [Kofleriaceae bacterium]
MGRVRIGTCSGTAEAALLRSMFDAHDIPVVVGGEHHANVLGGLAGSFISLDIWVDEADAEQAAALLADVRAGGSPVAEDPDSDDAAESSATDLWMERRRRTGVVLLLSVFVTFGTAHLYARKWFRGIVLGAIELCGFMMIRDGVVQPGVACVVGAIAIDAIGATIAVRAKPALPAARVVER